MCMMAHVDLAFVLGGAHSGLSYRHGADRWMELVFSTTCVWCMIENKYWRILLLGCSNHALWLVFASDSSISVVLRTNGSARRFDEALRGGPIMVVWYEDDDCVFGQLGEDEDDMAIYG